MDRFVGTRNLAGRVRRTLELAIGKESAVLILDDISDQLGIPADSLGTQHMEALSRLVRSATEKSFGPSKARFIEGVLKKYGEDAPTADRKVAGIKVERILEGAKTEDEVEKVLDQFSTDHFALDRFVIAPENKLAYDAASKVADWSAIPSTYFLHGPVGSGKTHLLNGIARQALLGERGARNMVVVPCHQLKEEFFAALGSGKLTQFEQIYHAADMLLVDDIQFVFGSRELEVELVSIFQRIVRKGGHVVVTSDRRLNELTLTNSQLGEFLENGNSLPMGYPGQVGRTQVLEQLAADQGWIVPGPVLASIAELRDGNMRGLRGGLTRVVQYSFLTGSAPTADLVREILA